MKVDKRAAKALIIDPDGYVLVLQRSDSHPHVPRTSDLPGGTLDDGEDAETALLRELREEIGFNAPEGSVQIVHHGFSRGYGKTVEIFLYVIMVEARPVVSLSYEHSVAEWIALREVKHTGFFEPAIKEYVQFQSAR